MPKEFAAALVMSIIIAFFSFHVRELSGEARIVPNLLLYILCWFNVLQYVLAWIRNRQKIDTVLSLRNYPLRRVAILCLLTVMYIAVLQWMGFYLASFIYFVVVSLLAQPMLVTPRLVAKRIAIGVLCIGFLYGLFTVGLSVQIPKGFMGF